MVDRDSEGQAPTFGQDTAFIKELRGLMLRFATQQLGDAHAAEDAVQDALLGAMKNAASFAGRAAFKTWVFAILRNKIADVLRRKQRMVEASRLLPEDAEQDEYAALFDNKGFWQHSERPVEWGDPEAAVREDGFWVVFEQCLERLPPAQARAFMMREFIELESDEICTALEISTTNLNVMLHRARLRLRECVENHWFLEGERTC